MAAFDADKQPARPLAATARGAGGSLSEGGSSGSGGARHRCRVEHAGTDRYRFHEMVGATVRWFVSGISERSIP